MGGIGIACAYGEVIGQAREARRRRGAARTNPDREADGVLKTRNKYCSNCLRTQRFLDLGTYLVCERCSKRLERAEPARETPETRYVPWIEPTKKRRDAM